MCARVCVYTETDSSLPGEAVDLLWDLFDGVPREIQLLETADVAHRGGKHIQTVVAEGERHKTLEYTQVLNPPDGPGLSEQSSIRVLK